MNTRLLRKVQKAILDHPDQFCMDRWFSDCNSVDQPAGGCGTAACIGGWAVFLSSKKQKLSFYDDDFDAYGLARRALGLSVPQGGRLFSVGSWPAKFNKSFHSALTISHAAAVAAARIDHFIKTKGKE